MRTSQLIAVFLMVALVPSGDTGASAADAGATAADEVRHEPAAPKPDGPVLVTARLAKGVTKPVLQLQVVEPGKYVCKSDPGYKKDWTDLPMRDDGKEGDAKVGDGVYSVSVPASFQRHRRLVRYRVVGIDGAGKAVQTPAADDACPNFAWWCYAGPSDWTGSREP